MTLLALATGKAESPPESILRLIVVEAGFPVPEAQYEITTIDGRRLYVLDMAWPALRIALEYDGFAAHEERRELDAERDLRMAGARVDHGPRRRRPISGIRAGCSPSLRGMPASSDVDRRNSRDRGRRHA